MKSLDNKILQLLSNNDVTFFIPPYQRNYEWDEEMCEILYKDIVRVAESENTQHFFGTVIYYAESTILGEPDRYILVDGQQRLTTTMLFLIAAREEIEDDHLKTWIDSKFLKNNNVSGDVEFKIKLKQVESDWNAYKNIILGADLDESDKKSNVFRNYNFFRGKIEKLEQDVLKSLIDKGLVHFNIVTIELEPNKNPWEKPQEIFESMNSLGKPLTLADLVRNYLLLGKTSDQQNKLYHNFWLKIEQNLSGNNNAFSVSAFIRDYMQLIDLAAYKKASETNYKQLYRDFKELFETESHENLLKMLAGFSSEYAILAGYKSSNSSKIDRKLSDLRIIESSGFNSFILGVLGLRTEKKIDDDSCLAILDAIFIYIARRRILRLTQGENKNAPTLVKYFDDLISTDDKKQKMLEILSNQPYALRLPNNHEIKAQLSSRESNFYNLRSSKFLYSLIEENLTRTRPDLSDKKLQVEHIMPQTLSNEWKNELGEDYQEIHDNYLNNIGNLTLIKHNSELGNDPFAVKKEIYINNAGMQIAKDRIIENEKWGEEQIENRATYLINILVDTVLPITENLRTSNNYSNEKKTINSSNRLSFNRLDLIGKEIYLIDRAEITAKVIGDKELLFEENRYRLSPLTRLCMERLGRANRSGAYWGVDKWGYQNKSLFDLMQEVSATEDGSESVPDEE